MKRHVILIGATAAVVATLAGCGGSDTIPPSPLSGAASSSGSSSSSSSSGSSSGGTAMMVDTRDVLAIAQQPSETDLPFGVDAGYTFTDTSETTTPVGVQ